MSLFERISNKIKDDLIIEMNKTGDDDPWDDKDTKTENKKKANKNKKFSNRKVITRTVDPSNVKQGELLNPETTPVGTEDTPISTKKKRGRKIGSKNKQPETNPNTQLTLDDIKKKRAPRKGVDYFFDPEKAKADREKLIAKRKEYGIDRKGNISDAGVERYAKKTKQLSSGSNIPVKITQADKDLAKKRLTDKYGRNLPRKRPSNAKSLEQIKKEIDSRPPDGRTTRTKVKTPSYKRIETKVTDKEIQDLIKQGQKATPKKTKNITFGARDKAIKDIDDLLIGEKPGEKQFTKKALRKQQRIVTKRITTPSKKEIEQSQKIIDKNKPKTSTQNLFDITGKKKKKLKTQQVNFDKFMKNLKLKSPPKTTGLYDPLKNKIPKLEPLKPLRIPKLKPSVVTKTATKTKLFPKVMKAVAKNPRTALAVGLLGLGTYGSIKNRIATNKLKKNKMLPPVSGGGNTVTTKPRDIELFLRTDSSRK